MGKELYIQIIKRLRNHFVDIANSHIHGWFKSRRVCALVSSRKLAYKDLKLCLFDELDLFADFKKLIFWIALSKFRSIFKLP